MSETLIPPKALAWIATHQNYLQRIQTMSDMLGALALAELSEDYFDKFGRELIEDLTTIFPKKGATDEPAE